MKRFTQVVFMICSLSPVCLNDARADEAEQLTREIKILELRTNHLIAQKIQLEAQKELDAITTPPQMPQKKIEILSAKYSFSQGDCNATGIVASSCTGKDECVIAISDSLCKKIERNFIEIQYECKGAPKTAVVPEGDKLFLNC